MTKFRRIKIISKGIEEKKGKKIILFRLIRIFLPILLFVIPTVTIIPYFIANIDSVKMIIEVSIIIAGFGLLAFQIELPSDSHKEEWFYNLRISTVLSFVSVILGFYYIISSISNYFFGSACCLYGAIVLIFLFVIFYKSKNIY